MALTNFAALNSQQKIVWSRELWAEARDMAFTFKFMSTSPNSCFQRVTELTRTEKGEVVLFQLLADLVNDGVIGDNEREGFEEEMKNYEETVTIDQISHGVRQKGKLADQKTVIRFRENARDRLAYWMANRIDQLTFLTLSGVAYSYTNNGGTRTDSAFANLAFASDVSAPTTNRHRRWDATSGLVAGDTTAVAADDTPTYETILEAVNYAKIHYVKPLMAGGKEYYVAFVRPETLMHLKKDPDYQRAITSAGPRSLDNPWFTGATVTIDGLVFHEHRLVFNTTAATSGAAKWGASSNIDGSRTLICGSQALVFADLNSPEWSEKWFQYDSSPGINVDKMFGMVKPKFHSIYDGSTEDFGVIALDHAI